MKLINQNSLNLRFEITDIEKSFMSLLQSKIVAISAATVWPFSNKILIELFLLIGLSMNVVNLATASELSDMPSGKYSLDLSHASIVFKVDHLGFSTYVGRFTDFEAEISLDSQEFKQSSVDVEVKVDSISTNYPFPEKEDFDKKLSEQWFKSAEFPNMNFSSTSLSPLDNGKARLEGELTMLGNTHPIAINIRLNKAAVKHPLSRKPTIGFSATADLDRTVWGLNNFAPKVGARVSIEIEGEFVHQALN